MCTGGKNWQLADGKEIMQCTNTWCDETCGFQHPLGQAPPDLSESSPFPQYEVQVGYSQCAGQSVESDVLSRNSEPATKEFATLDCFVDKAPPRRIQTVSVLPEIDDRSCLTDSEYYRQRPRFVNERSFRSSQSKRGYLSTADPVVSRVLYKGFNSIVSVYSRSKYRRECFPVDRQSLQVPNLSSNSSTEFTGRSTNRSPVSPVSPTPSEALSHKYPHKGVNELPGTEFGTLGSTSRSRSSKLSVSTHTEDDGECAAYAKTTNVRLIESSGNGGSCRIRQLSHCSVEDDAMNSETEADVSQCVDLGNTAETSTTRWDTCGEVGQNNRSGRSELCHKGVDHGEKFEDGGREFKSISTCVEPNTSENIFLGTYGTNHISHRDSSENCMKIDYCDAEVCNLLDQSENVCSYECGKVTDVSMSNGGMKVLGSTVSSQEDATGDTCSAPCLAVEEETHIATNVPMPTPNPSIYASCRGAVSGMPTDGPQSLMSFSRSTRSPPRKHTNYVSGLWKVSCGAAESVRRQTTANGRSPSSSPLHENSFLAPTAEADDAETSQYGVEVNTEAGSDDVQLDEKPSEEELACKLPGEESWVVKRMIKQKFETVALARCFREVEILRRLRHPHIVRLISVVDSRDELWMILEHAIHGDLHDLTKLKTLSENHTKRLMYQILSALLYTHQSGMLHGDIKPQNVLLFAAPLREQDSSSRRLQPMRRSSSTKNWCTPSTRSDSTSPQRAPAVDGRDINEGRSGTESSDDEQSWSSMSGKRRRSDADTSVSEFDYDYLDADQLQWTEVNHNHTTSTNSDAVSYSEVNVMMEDQQAAGLADSPTRSNGSTQDTLHEPAEAEPKKNEVNWDTVIVKICDFGLAQYLNEDGIVPFTGVLGTQSYIAPEILRNVDYDAKIDIWACGVIAFQLLGGYEPFFPPSASRTARLEFEPRYWAGMSDEAKDFIKQTLERNVPSRLTSSEALNHRWFDSLGVDGHRDPS